MKIGVTQIILSKWSLDDILEMCQDAGYEALELVFSEGGDPDINMSDDEIRGVKKKCDDAGIEIGSCMSGYAERGSLVSMDSAEREKGMKSLKRSVHIANVLGVTGILLHPGHLTVEGTYEQVWDNMVGHMKDIAPEAQEKGVAIGVENVWNKFLLTSKEMRDFVDAVGNEWIGCYLDTANMMLYGFPEHWIRGLQHRIKRVHFKDFSRRERTFTHLMDGETDWPEVMKGLRDIGYDYPVIHEVGGDRDVQIEMAKRMKKIVAM
jgi:hexulose-6-phosphate isomerase